MKKLTAFIAFVLCVALLCTGCAKEVSFKEYHKDTVYEDYAPLLTEMEELGALSGMTLADSYNEILVLDDIQEETSQVIFYNMDTESVILKQDKGSVWGTKFFTAGDHTFFVVATGKPVNGSTDSPTSTLSLAELESIVKELEEYGFSQSEIDEVVSYYMAEMEAAGLLTEQEPTKYTVYDANGDVVKSTHSDQPIGYVYDAEADLFSFAGVIYRVAEDGSVSEVVTAPFFGDIPSFDYKAGEFYYAIGDTEVTVYDAALNNVLYWEAPRSDIEECIITPLGGNIFVQLMTPLFDHEDKYDFIADETKYDMESYIISAKTGKVSSAELDYIILSAEAAMDADKWDSEYAYIAKIENQRVLDAESALEYVALNAKNGSIKSVIMSDLQGKTTLLAEDRFVYETYNGDKFLMDGEGSIIGKINKIGDLTRKGRTQTYIVLDGKLYDYDLQEVYDFITNDMFVERVMGHSVLFRNTTDHRLYLYTRADENTALPENTELILCNDQFLILRSETEYLVFNEDGKQLGTVSDASDLEIVTRDTEACVFSVRSENSFEYYKLSGPAAE